jgi:hypothetical protein
MTLRGDITLDSVSTVCEYYITVSMKRDVRNEIQNAQRQMRTVANTDRGRTTQVASFQKGEMSEMSGSRTQGEPTSVFKEFCGDLESIRSLGVTNQELEALSRASLLGTLTCKEDLLFILRHLREKVHPTKMEVSIADSHKMTEDLRQAALTKLHERDGLIAKRNNSALGRIRLILRQAHSVVARRFDKPYRLARRYFNATIAPPYLRGRENP